MPRPVLILLLLMACVLTLTGFVVRNEALRGSSTTKSALAVLFGDGRRLFANHFLTKADAYFHRGRYPSIFEMAERERHSHLVESLADELDESGRTPDADHDHEHETRAFNGSDRHHTDGEDDGHEHDEFYAQADALHGANDWISRLAARFEPDRHVHLEGAEQKEILPWVQLAVEMDPHNVEAYAIGGYWLRRMGKPDAAETFLREGLRNNPRSTDLCFELARLYESQAGRRQLAIRLYELSLEKWHAANEGKEEPDSLALAGILAHLGRAYEEADRLEEALRCYTLLETVASNPEAIRHRIDSVKERIAAKNTEL